MKRNVALIVLYDDKKRILLQQRTEDASRLPGYIAFFGGGIEKGETPEDAVKRETLEELNYKLINPKIVLTKQQKGKDFDGTKHVFIEKYDQNQQLILNEGRAMIWTHFDEIEHLKIINHDREIIKLLKLILEPSKAKKTSQERQNQQNTSK
ncbi:MAG: NUDIX domain-containing protein [Nanoarchaeota archaeon]|nr:NUDIX domain-containing protein [Nanoarchaeota archaeon]